MMTTIEICEPGSYLIVALVFLVIGYFMGRTKRTEVHGYPREDLADHPVIKFKDEMSSMEDEPDYFQEELENYELPEAGKRIPTIL